MTAYHVCLILLFLSFAWVDLGLCSLEDGAYCDKGQQLEVIITVRKSSIKDFWTQKLNILKPHEFFLEDLMQKGPL